MIRPPFPSISPNTTDIFHVDGAIRRTYVPLDISVYTCMCVDEQCAGQSGEGATRGIWGDRHKRRGWDTGMGCRIDCSAFESWIGHIPFIWWDDAR